MWVCSFTSSNIGIDIFREARTRMTGPQTSVDFSALPELVFVTEDQLRRIGQGQPEINPGAAEVEMQCPGPRKSSTD